MDAGELAVEDDALAAQNQDRTRDALEGYGGVGALGLGHCGIPLAADRPLTVLLRQHDADQVRPDRTSK